MVRVYPVVFDIFKSLARCGINYIFSYKEFFFILDQISWSVRRMKFQFTWYIQLVGIHLSQ